MSSANNVFMKLPSPPTDGITQIEFSPSPTSNLLAVTTFCALLESRVNFSRHLHCPIFLESHVIVEIDEHGLFV